ncbi:MAG: hypothetical protein GXO84_10725 [Chlorobi bacterium]|nr:hypothetical protein [Chlorobiota bacterium]
MRKIKLILGTLMIVSLFLQNIYAQKLSEEKIVELTGKSKKRGYLGNLIVNDTKQQFDMVFVTRLTNRKIKYEIYQFDYNFNFINNFNEERDVVYTKPDKKTKTRKKNKYKGEDIITKTGVTARSNKIGKLVLEKTQTTFKYNWWTGNYEKSTKLLKKQKPTEIDSDGGDKKRQLFYIAHRDLPWNGKTLVCALVNKGMSKMYKEANREYLLMDIDSNLSITKKVTLSFDHPQSLLFSKELTDKNEWIMVFASYGGSGYKKIADPDPTNLTYVKVNGNGEIMEQFNFKSKCNMWGIYDAYILGDDIYLYGGGKIDKPEKQYATLPFTITNDYLVSKITPEDRKDMLESEKFTHLQIAKISGGKAEFVSAISIEEINAKGIKPPNQKKMKEFNGKKFIINSVNITSNGDIFINGQDFSYDAVGKVHGRVFKNLLMFQFDKSGGFKRFYTIDNTANGGIGGAAGVQSIPVKSFIYESPTNPNELFWLMSFCKDIDEDCYSDTKTTEAFDVKYKETTTTCITTPLYQAKLAKIDISAGKLYDVNTFGGDDFYLYTDVSGGTDGNDLPYFKINGGKQIVYVARQRKGGIKGNERWSSKIWFGKFDPLKQ